MMMNFKKNQNNAVCSMDCKNCPHGASQPNPMDDPMFEKSIAMLHNWVMLEAIREDHYVLRPLLRPRLTQSRSALPWKP